MFSGFFIRRPIFAIVISVVITLAGLLALSAIPISQYPNITPPQVTVSVSYPGASAETVAKVVGQPIEEQVNGVPDMLYMQSTSSSSGTYSLQVTFAIGTDPNIDQVNVQNRVQLAEALLPTEVQQEGITVRAASSNFVLAVNLYSKNNKYDQVFISNYAYMHLQQQIARTSGVGNTQIFGQRQYAMRIWLNPVRMTALGITATDVINAIQAQNIQAAAGQIGQPPIAEQPAAANHGARPRPAEHAAAIRRHHHPHQSQRRRGAGARHRRCRAGGAAIHLLLGAGRQSLGDARDLSGAECQRAGGRGLDREADAGVVEAVPGGAAPTRSSTTPPTSCAPISTRSCARWRSRWRWWWRWYSCSCRTGGRR